MRIPTVALLLAAGLFAQPEIRPVPAPGVEVSPSDRKELEAGLARLKEKIGRLKSSLDENRQLLIPDVSIFHEAVRYALHYNEFLKAEEIARAKELLRQGDERATALLAGGAPWTEQTGLVIRGYVSRIDGSVQPYGLVIPPSWSAAAARDWRLDAWFHGRSETLTEVNFLHDRQRAPGQFTPRDTIVLHLYGRYCNANKFAGEIDLFEALADVRKKYRIDPDRISIRGFSMGGAAVWHIAAHYGGRFFAAAPGAGFSETAEFLQVFARESVKPAWWEQKLWRLYDATEYAANFFNLPTVAYSGEKDRQKQAADIMAKALAREGMKLTHIIGPGTEHRYHPDAIVEINRRMDAIAAHGREAAPRRVRFTTFTLRYNRMKWVAVDALAKHWERGSVDAQVSRHGVEIKTSGVTAFHLAFDSGLCPFEPDQKTQVSIDGQTLNVAGPETDRSWSPHFVSSGGKWAAATLPSDGLRKRHTLQGPIDDAFLSRFIIVQPTGAPFHAKTGEWVKSEMDRAIGEWRRQFRGEAIVKKDTEITDADIAASNLILWGDPSSNQVLAKVIAKLPIQWNAQTVAAGGASFNASMHAPALIYPNPLNPRRYVVLNSGFTYREYDYLNNARQVPKLPDYAVVDVTAPPDARWPGRIALAGFFGEHWELQPNHGQ
jgi:pimeloyl-ACP methyl ester carboxylesterase